MCCRAVLYICTAVPLQVFEYDQVFGLEVSTKELWTSHILPLLQAALKVRGSWRSIGEGVGGWVDRGLGAGASAAGASGGRARGRCV